MSINKIYLEETLKKINEIENKYNFVPKENEQKNCTIDKLCLGKTQSIASLRKRNIATKKLEEALKTYREYAIKNFS